MADYDSDGDIAIDLSDSETLFEESCPLSYAVVLSTPILPSDRLSIHRQPWKASSQCHPNAIIVFSLGGHAQLECGIGGALRISVPYRWGKDMPGQHDLVSLTRDAHE